MRTISQLEPTALWHQFQALSAIPRCSKCEDQVIQYIENLARSRDRKTLRDSVGNLVVKLPASKGMEEREGMILQGHVDMVCEKNRGTDFNFERDGISLVVDGEWLRAEGTTLGADNGIAVAYMMTLIAGDFVHGPLELLFTIDEETGLTGALDLDPSLLEYRRLLNIDTEEEGHFCIGCAGGKETIGTLAIKTNPLKDPQLVESLEISLTGLRGGHSGADIHLELGNALVLMARVARDLKNRFDYQLISLVGGDKHNAIPREAFLQGWFPKGQIQELEQLLTKWKEILLAELGEEDSGLDFQLRRLSQSEAADPLSPQVQANLELMLQSIPHGILAWSRTMPGMVSTSTNLAAVKQEAGRFEVLTSQRSDIESLRDEAGYKVGSVFEACGFQVEYTRQYPGWTPDPNSPLLHRAMKAYKEATGDEPIIEAIHAGLECGVIGDKIPGIQMISFGPDIRGAHTPQEKVKIDSVARVWNFLLTLLAQA